MFPSQYLLLLTFPLAIVGVGASTILPRQQGCTLNPAGKGVSIQIPVNTSTDFPFLELATPSVAPDAFLLAVNSVHGFAQPDFHLQQNGQANPSYIITDVSDNSLALTYIGFDNGDRLTLEPISNSGNDPTQLWDFTCSSCNPNAASLPSGSGAILGASCRMHPHSVPNACVQVVIARGTPFPVVFPEDCDLSNPLQVFNVVL